MKILVVTFSVFLSIFSWAQEFPMEMEKELYTLYTAIMETNDDAERLERSAEFMKTLRQSLYKPGAFDHPFSSLRMCTQKSPDAAFRLFNWNVPMKSGKEKYFGLIMHWDKKKKMAKLTELTDHSDEVDKPESKTLTADKWYGALYYDIVPFKKGGKKYYLLLGWDGYSNIMNKKLVDVVSFNGRGPKFGAPVFKERRGAKRRLIYSYAEDLSMTLRYFPKQKKIIMDHLAPQNPSLEGQYQFYMPDASFDAYAFHKGKWVLEQNVKFERERTAGDREFRDPRVKD